MILSGSNAAQKIYLTHVKFLHVHEIKLKQANRGDMRKIHVTRHFFKGSGRHGDLIEKTKNPFLDFRSVSLLVWRGDVTQTNT